MHPSAVVTQFTISCAVELLRLVTSDDIMTSSLKKLLISIKIGIVKLLRSPFGQFPNCRRASCEFCSHRQRDTSRQLSHVGVSIGRFSCDYAVTAWPAVMLEDWIMCLLHSIDRENGIMTMASQ